MHGKKNGSNNLQHRGSVNGDHQAKPKQIVAAEAHCTVTRPTCLQNLAFNTLSKPNPQWILEADINLLSAHRGRDFLPI
jgi:hypothetical protein